MDGEADSVIVLIPDNGRDELQLTVDPHVKRSGTRAAEVINRQCPMSVSRIQTRADPTN